MTSPLQLRPQPSATTVIGLDLAVPIPGAVQADATSMIAIPRRELNAAERALSQMAASVGQLLRDPVGTTIEMGRGIVHDINAVAGIQPDELKDPQLRANIEAMFGSEMLAELERVAQQNATNFSSEERKLAGQRLFALGAASVISPIVGRVAGGVFAASTAAGPLATTLARTTAQGVAFGTVGGALTPVEEEQTRLGNVLTWNAIAVPFATVGGVTSYALRSHLRARGIKPELETPEIGTIPEVEFDPIQAARMDRPRNVTRLLEKPTVAEVEATVAPLVEPIRDPARLLPRAAQEPPRLTPGEASPAPAAEVSGLPVQVVRDAVTTIIDKMAIGERPARAPLTWNALYTALVDDLHPINHATKQLLRLMRETEKRALQQGVSGSVALRRPGTSLEVIDRPRLPGARGVAETMPPGDVVVEPPPLNLKPGERLSGLEDPYVLARLTRGSTAKSTQFLETGPLDFETLQPVGPGLRAIMQPIMDAGPEALANFRAFLVAPRTLELAERGIKTPFSVEAARNVAQNSPNFIMNAGLATFKYTDQVLQYVVDAGLVSTKAAEVWRDMNRHYVPFYRLVENPDAPPAGPSAPPRFANVDPRIKPIKGGERLKVVDPLENIVRNTYALVSAADRHIVAESLVRLAERAPDQQVVQRVAGPRIRSSNMTRVRADLERIGVKVTDEIAQELAEAFSPQTSGLPEGTFWVLREGKKQYYSVDNDLYRALLNMDAQETNILLRIIEVPTSIQKAGFTAFTPSFAIRNPIRDSFSATVFSRFGFKPGVDLARGIFHALGQDKLFTAFRRSGGEHAVLTRSLRSERLTTQRVVDDLLRSDSRLSWIWRNSRNPRGWLEMMRRFSELMEEATRSQEFARGLAQSGDQRLAGFGARDVTLDFARMGWAMRVFNRIIPFLNPFVQDADKILRTFGAEGGKRAAGATARAIASITVPTFILYLLNRDDPNYQEMSNFRKDFMWNIPMWRWNEEEGALERSGHIPIPKPFTLGVVFGSVPERIFRWIDKRDPTAFDGLAQTLLRTATPPIMPGIITPAVEVATNYDFFRNRPIIGQREMRFIAEERAGPLQGETTRLIGKALGVSPRNVEHLIEGYTGGVGREALRITDALLRVTGVRRPVDPSDPQTPILEGLLRSFFKGEPTLDAQSVQNFYQHLGEINEVVATGRMFMASGRTSDATALIQDTRDLMVTYQSFNQTALAISQLRTQMRVVQARMVQPSVNTVERERLEGLVLQWGRAIRLMAQKSNEMFRRVADQFGDVQSLARPATGNTLDFEPPESPK